MCDTQMLVVIKATSSYQLTKKTMNTNLLDIFEQYLRIETNYAVILNGSYGIGKTHFFKQELSKKIKEISLPKDERKKYIPIHISLFGFKTLEEIQTAIFVELFPILKSKGVKLAAGIGKSIIRGIAQINKAGDIDKYIGDVTQDAKDWLNYDELVICFDDLDRKSEALDLRDVFGFVNSLVENQGVKILFIANEKQLIKDVNYSSELREKVIGVSIQFVPNPSTIYEQIIKSRYESSNKVYFEFLKKYQPEIILAIEKNENNFRNLIFFLEHFKTIFYLVKKEFEDDAEFALLQEDKEKAILYFSLSIAIEYKLGHLNSTNIEEIEGISNNSISNIDFTKLLGSHNHSKTEQEERKPTYIEIFNEKYYSKTTFYFFKSIFDYLTGSNAFNINNLKSELDNYFITEEGEIPKQEKLLKQLAYLDCLELSNFEYRKLTTTMLKYSDQGLFQLSQFYTVFHFATRFNNMMGYDLENIKARVKKGIRKGKSKYKYQQNLDFYMPVSNDAEYKVDLIEIVKYCLSINDSLKERKEEVDLENYFKLFLEDFDKFESTLNEPNNELQFTSFWTRFDILKVYKRIRKMNNSQIWRFGHYVSSRYSRNIFEKLYPEKDFVIELYSLIDNNTKERKKKNLQNASLDYLYKCLRECELNFP